MKNLLAISSLALLAACASTQTVLDGDVDEIVNSTRAAPDVAACLANRNANRSETKEAPDGAKIVLLKNGYNAVAITFTVTPVVNGSQISIRRQFPIVGITHRQCYY